MAETETDENSFLKSSTELEKVGLTFSSLFSLARPCTRGDIAPFKVYAASETKLNRLIAVTKDLIQGIGLEWNPKKCNVIHMTIP